MVVQGSDGAVDLEVAGHALDAVALAVEALAIADRLGAIWLWRNDGLDAVLLPIMRQARSNFAAMNIDRPSSATGGAVMMIPFSKSKPAKEIP